MPHDSDALVRSSCAECPGAVRAFELRARAGLGRGLSLRPETPNRIRGSACDQVAVSEGEAAYSPGACAELKCSDSPGTFGTTRTDKGVRIVWHYQAQSEPRRFRIHYRLRGVATAYDDVVDVNVKVWGDEWEVASRRASSPARPVAPGRDGAVLDIPSASSARYHRRYTCQPAGTRHSSRPVRRSSRSSHDGSSPRPRG